MKFRKNVLLKNYTTFRIGGPAQFFYLAETRGNLIKAIKAAKKINPVRNRISNGVNLPFFILGEGSNLLVSDKGYDGLVIKIKNKKLKIKNKKIFCDAGVSLSTLVKKAAGVGLTGLEWAAGIPGTVGGAIHGNTGAFGGAMADVVKTVTVLEIQNPKSKFQIKNRDCHFEYRSSIFKNNPNLIILSCELQLKKGDRQKIKEKIKEYLNYRRERHPSLPSAGSVFKNVSLEKLSSDFFKKFPEVKNVIKENILPTAYLIDQCNLKGKKIGKAQISKVHPNFIVNLGGAKAKDVLKLINLAKRRVKNKFNKNLEEEIQFLGNF